MCGEALRSQNRALDLLEVELQISVNLHVMWVMDIETGSSARRTNALNHQAISPGTHLVMLI